MASSCESDDATGPPPRPQDARGTAHRDANLTLPESMSQCTLDRLWLQPMSRTSSPHSQSASAGSSVRPRLQRRRDPRRSAKTGRAATRRRRLSPGTRRRWRRPARSWPCGVQRRENGRAAPPRSAALPLRAGHRPALRGAHAASQAGQDCRAAPHPKFGPKNASHGTVRHREGGEGVCRPEARVCADPR
jgi:hypothetical protein